MEGDKDYQEVERKLILGMVPVKMATHKRLWQYNTVWSVWVVELPLWHRLQSENKTTDSFCVQQFGWTLTMKALARYTLSFLTMILFVIFFVVCLRRYRTDESLTVQQHQSFLDQVDIFSALQYENGAEDFEYACFRLFLLANAKFRFC